MAIRRSGQRFSATRLAATARRLLGASTLCAIATVTGGGRAYVNTAYFAWSPDLDLVWISDPGSRHSRNLRERSSAAISVYDSHQTWGERDRGIQLFGTARELTGRAAADAARLYGRRFRSYDREELSRYRLYRLRPSRIKLFDERAQGGGLFVTVRVQRGGRLQQTSAEQF